MKYPIKQFNVLVEVLKNLNNFISLKDLNPNNLHFLVFQQFSDGQKHNRLITNNGKLYKKYSLVNGDLVRNEGKDFEVPEFNFELYPNNTNDSNIETAINKALKQL
ncbi:MAG: hypothetical protein CMH22_06075 [Methylophaga sp.]|nr:hypothetical protein [Methylophaga sp.]|tara:strand:+ start:54253 stop:54570 length:318 start_codon:yes stop_codon:yes gene_type:complete